MGKHSSVTADGANNHPPKPHAASHGTSGSDVLTPASIGAADLAATATTHSSIVTSSHGSQLVGTEPTPVNIGAVMGLQFSANDLGFRVYKIPASFVGSPSVHVHWTKSSDANEFGKTVLWRVSYTVFNGSSDDVNIAPATVDLQDSYDDAGTTTRLIHRTDNGALTGFVAGKYVAVQVGRATPSGTPLSADPILISLDLLMTESINVGT